MDLLIDSADVKEIEAAKSWGLISGVTTNPTLYGRQVDDHLKRLNELVEVSPGVVYTQVIGWHNTEEMIKQAVWLAAQSDRIIVKLPMSNEGIQACLRLKRNHPTMKIAITAVASLAQAFLCGKAGADVVALFNGPLDQEVDTWFELVGPVKKMYANYGYQTKVLSACRYPRGFAEYCIAGTDICTMKREFLELLYEHAYTDKRMHGFAADWQAKFGDTLWPMS